MPWVFVALPQGPCLFACRPNMMLLACLPWRHCISLLLSVPSAGFHAAWHNGIDRMTVRRQVLEAAALGEPTPPAAELLQPDHEGLAQAKAEVDRFKVGRA